MSSKNCKRGEPLGVTEQAGDANPFTLTGVPDGGQPAGPEGE